MHQVLHVVILCLTVIGGAGLALLVLWPLVADGPLPGVFRWALTGLVALAGALFLLEWAVVH